MIKKNTLLIAIVVGLSLIANAQTREETIEWINSKLTKYGNNRTNNELVMLENEAKCIRIEDYQKWIMVDSNEMLKECCVTKWSRQRIDGKIIDKHYEVEVCDLKTVTKVFSDEDCLGHQDLIIIGIGSKGNSKPMAKQEFLILLAYDAEENLLNRMVKAFEHLIELNRSIPKLDEKF